VAVRNISNDTKLNEKKIIKDITYKKTKDTKKICPVHEHTAIPKTDEL
jgi:hypothetical protein